MEEVGIPALLVAAVAVAFAPALGNGFVLWDDDLNLTDNPRYRGLSPAHLRWMLTTVHGGHWQPLTWLTLALDHALWGMSPAGYHLTNLVLHAACVVAVYLLTRALLHLTLPEAGVRRALAGAAAAGALLFGIHPLRVESVAWVSERRDVLSGLLLVLTVLAYLHAHTPAGGGDRRWSGAALGCYVLSLLAKAWGMTLPLVLLALDVYPLRRLPPRADERAGRVLIEKLPYALLALGAAVQAARAQRVEAALTLAEHGVVARVMQAAYGLVFYLGKTVVPLGLSPLYLLERPLDPTAPRYLVSLAFVLAVTACLVVWRRRWPWALQAWLCYVIVVSPVLGFLQSGSQITADRYTYLACLPWAVLAAAGVHRLGRQLPPAAVGAGCAVVGLALTALTYRQTFVWRDSASLWNHVVGLDARNYIALMNRGLVRHAAGELEGALADFNTALELNPGYAQAYNNRGITRLALGDVDGALADYDAALGLRARYADAHLNRAIAREAKGDRTTALADYAEALRLDPTLAPAYYGRANLRAAADDLDGAIADYGEALRLDPTYVEAYNNRALARRRRGDEAGARADLTRALALLPPGSPRRATVERNLTPAPRH